MPTVTVPGSSGTLTYTFGAGAGLSVAQQISNALAAAATSGTFSVASSASVIPNPSTVAGTTQELVLTGNPTTSVPAGYNFVVNDTSSPSTITAAAGTSILSSTGGGLFAESGAATIVAAGGNNVISQSGAGSILLAGGSGNDTITATGSGSIFSGTGTDLLIAGGNSEVVTATGSDSVRFGAGATSNNDTIFASAGSTTSVYGSSGQLLFVSSGAAVSMVGGAGSASTSSLVGSGGADSLNAGAGGLVYQVGTSNNSTVNTGASGTATVFGATNAQVNVIGGGSSTVVAAGGNETLNASGSAGPVWLSVSTSVTTPGATVMMNAGSGNDTLIAGSAAGSTIMNGGSGSDAFVFFKQAAGGAHDIISNFTQSDSVYIEGYGAGSASALQQAATVGAGGLTLTLSDGTTVTFSNMTDPTQLNGKIQYG
jgi:Ca2+-binding RTX toxin-like protein